MDMDTGYRSIYIYIYTGIYISLGGTGTPTWATKLSLHNLIKKITPLITTEIYRNREFKIAMHVKV